LALAMMPVKMFGTRVLDFNSPGNNPVGYYYVSPYTATVKGTGSVLTLYCIDFNHDISTSEEWTANLNPLSKSYVSNYQYGSTGTVPSVWMKYEMAAYLITQLSQTTDKQQQAIDEYAAWKVFLDTAHTGAFDASVAAAGGATFAAAINTAYANAQSAVANGYTPVGWAVVTPDPAGLLGSPQEFLTTANELGAVPEPSSIVLLVTVVGGIGFMRFRRGAARNRG